MNRYDAVLGLERIEAFFQGSAYGMHRHDTYAIGCTVAGVQAFHYRGAHRHSLPGHTMVLHPDESHDGQAGTDAGFHYRMLYLDPALVQTVLGGQALPFVPGGTTENPRLRHAARPLLMPPDGPADALEATDAVVELALALQAAAGAHRQGPAGDFASAQCAHQFLSASWQRPVTMDELSAVTGRDRWGLARDFRRFYGTSPSRFLILRRLDAARQHMLAGLPLAEVAAATGFADQAHLTRHFTQTYGIPPATWLRTAQARLP